MASPGQEPGEATGATGARAGDFPGGSLGAQAPSLAQGVPTSSLDPRRTPASRDRRPPASMGRGHMGPGCEQLANFAANPQTPPSRHPHWEDPPVLPSVKGTPFTDGRTGVGPQEMAVVQAAAGWFPAKSRGLAGTRQAPPPQTSLWQRAPPLRYQPRFTGSLGSCPGNWKPSLPPRGPCVFPRTTLPSRSPTPAEAECPGKTWGPWSAAGGRPQYCARRSVPGRV